MSEQHRKLLAAAFRVQDDIADIIALGEKVERDEWKLEIQQYEDAGGIHPQSIDSKEQIKQLEEEKDQLQRNGEYYETQSKGWQENAKLWQSRSWENEEKLRQLETRLLDKPTLWKEAEEEKERMRREIEHLKQQYKYLQEEKEGWRLRSGYNYDQLLKMTKELNRLQIILTKVKGG